MPFFQELHDGAPGLAVQSVVVGDLEQDGQGFDDAITQRVRIAANHLQDARQAMGDGRGQARRQLAQEQRERFAALKNKMQGDPAELVRSPPDSGLAGSAKKSPTAENPNPNVQLQMKGCPSALADLEVPSQLFHVEPIDLEKD